MKPINEILLERRSIRRYEREPIPEETKEFIRKAVENTPTSYNGQQFSVIEISNQELKEQLYELTGQKQLKTCNWLLIFCSDYHKISLLAKQKGLEMPPFTDTMDGTIIGIVDASLAMMSAVAAAEGCGLGCNCVGYLRTVDPQKVAELLKLPEGVFVVCGLAIGIPREHPDLKPKQKGTLVFHKNEYTQDTNSLLSQLENYDAVITEYNQKRSGSTSNNDWCGHILDYYRHAMDYRILDYLKQQGYNINK